MGFLFRFLVPFCLDKLYFCACTYVTFSAVMNLQCLLIRVCTELLFDCWPAASELSYLTFH